MVLTRRLRPLEDSRVRGPVSSAGPVGARRRPEVSAGPVGARGPVGILTRVPVARGPVARGPVTRVPVVCPGEVNRDRTRPLKAVGASLSS